MQIPTLLHEHFEFQALHTPHAIAAVAGSSSLTYGELSQKSNIVAANLLHIGVVPDQLVGLCVDRSVHMLIALLGILKSGAAYVPLDPGYPQERLSFMSANAGIDIVITDRSTHDLIAAQRVRRLFLDDLLLLKARSAVPLPLVTPHHLAYAMYTSGSTGQPKGVLIEHRNIVPFISWAKTYFTQSPFTYTLCANSLSFDVSIFEMFATLAVGGTLVIVKNILDLLTAPPVQPISVMIAAPSSVAEIVRARAVPVSTRTIIFGGERLPIRLVHDLYETTNVREVFNSWGVTEDSIGSAFVSVPRSEQHDPPMGYTISGRHLYLLDEHLQEAAIGETGEIYCGGYGVARGYLRLAELNAERFIANPFGDSPTMYRTGDLAVRRADGALVFSGRNDQQIKMHGFRIELGEIESVLHTHPHVAQAAVLAYAEIGRLDMYIVPRNGAILTLTDLQAFLADRLPIHMIPNVLTCVANIPCGPTGKLDRSALEALQNGAEESSGYLAPIDPFEETLALLFAAVLGRKRVGVDDNFFALGGKSLLAARLGTEIRSAFPHEVAQLEVAAGNMALNTAFAFEPTVRYFAALLQQKEQLPKRHEALYCIQGGSPLQVPLFVFHGVITGEALYCYALARAVGEEQPLYALAPHGLDGAEVPESVEEMARDYVARIRTVQAQGPYHFMGYCNGGLVAFEAARQLRSQGQTVETLVLIASPGHNVRHRVLKACVDFCARVLHAEPKRSLQWFITSRDHAYFLKYSLEYFIQSLSAKFRGRENTAQTPRERLLKARLLGPQMRNEHPSFYGIMQAVQAYVPQRYEGRICLVWGKDDEYLRYYDPREDWKQVSRKLHFDFVEGDHHFLNTNAEQLLEHFPHRDKPV